MHVRVLAILLTVLVAVGIASPSLAASPATASQVDDGMPDPEPAIVATVVEIVPPPRRELRCLREPPAAPRGRLHRVWVFRPPRPSASR